MELLLLLGLVGAFSFLDLSSGNSTTDDPEQEGPNPSQRVLNGSNADDSLIGAASGQTLNGLAGDDSLEGFGGDDSLYGGDGQDMLVGGRGADLFYGGNGDDQIREDWYVVSNPSELDDGNDTAYGGAGNDYIRTLSGDDSVFGGGGNDTVWADDGDDTLIGDAGHDDLFGGEGDDILDGGLGNDLLDSGAGMSTLSGGDGNDTLAAMGISITGALNTSQLYGGAGNDVLSFTDGSTVSGGTGADQFFLTDRLDDTLVSRIEDFDPDEDSLRIDVTVEDGDGGGFALVARADDLGRDLYIGDDLVAEILSSKPFTLADMEFVVRLDYPEEGVTTYTVGPQDASLDITLVGSDGDDRIFGSSGADSLNGARGSDLLEGGGGNDTLFGDGGRVETFSFDDEVFEQRVVIETDTLVGGAGDDDLMVWNGGVMTGGAGSDVFLTRLNFADPAIIAQFPPAVITDFDPAQDVLVLGPVGGVFPTPTDIQLRMLGDGTGTEVLVRGIVVARVIGGQSLTVADIQIENIEVLTDYRAA
jgi:Ca2+-binding RTX toxin-like protein